MMWRYRSPILMLPIVAVATLVIITTILVSTHSSGTKSPLVTVPTSLSETIPQRQCTTAENLNDYQMNECLITELTAIKAQLHDALGREAHHLISSTPKEAKQVVNAAEVSFEHYVRAECLAEANPYMGGTIFPIVFGSCEVTLYQQRLRLVVQQTTNSLAN